MAGLNEIQEGGLGQVLRRRLGILATGSPAPELAPEVFPCLVLENDRLEFSFLKGERRAAATSVPAAGAAGTFAFMNLSNRTGSGQLVVVERVKVQVGSGTTVRVCLVNHTGFSGTPVSAAVRDGRYIQPGATQAFPASAVSVGTAPEDPVNNLIDACHISSTIDITDVAVLRPGQTLLVQAQTEAQAIARVTIFWRERGLVPGELNA